jgi:hypothetical protein
MSREEDADARRRFACPHRRGRFEGLELELLDPGDPDDRRVLIEAEHPELRKALRRGDDEILLHGQPMSPRLHITFHEIVANQLWNDDPPDVWRTVLRLSELGHERHEILHMLCSVVAREVWTVQTLGRPGDPDRYAAALDELPDSYFALADPE